jgi:hypothetical protein
MWSSVQLYHLCIFSYQRDLGHIDEQAMFDHTGDAAQGMRERGRIGNLPEGTVQDVMAFVGDVGVAVGVASKRNLRAESFDLRLNQRLRKSNHLNRKREPAQPMYALAGIGNHDKASRNGGDNFFAEQRASAAFDQIQLGIDFIGPIDVDVDGLMLFECPERNPELLGQLLGFLRSWDADDL